MALWAERNRPDGALTIFYHGVEVVVIFRASLPALITVIRLRSNAPDEVVDFVECLGKSFGSCMKKEQVAGKLFNLRLWHIRLPTAEECIRAPAVTAEGEDRG